MYMPDAYDQWKRHDAEQSKWLERLPVCSDCGEPIQDEQCYLINDEPICQECMKLYLIDVDSYIG